MTFQVLLDIPKPPRTEGAWVLKNGVFWSWSYMYSNEHELKQCHFYFWLKSKPDIKRDTLPRDSSIAVRETSGTKWFGIKLLVTVFPILLHKKWRGRNELDISRGCMKQVNVFLRVESTLSGNTLCMGLLATEVIPCHCHREAQEFSLHMFKTSASKISFIWQGSSIFSVDSKCK